MDATRCTSTPALAPLANRRVGEAGVGEQAGHPINRCEGVPVRTPLRPSPLPPRQPPLVAPQRRRMQQQRQHRQPKPPGLGFRTKPAVPGPVRPRPVGDRAEAAPRTVPAQVGRRSVAGRPVLPDLFSTPQKCSALHCVVCTGTDVSDRGGFPLERVPATSVAESANPPRFCTGPVESRTTRRQGCRMTPLTC